jgi:hypothetical protein
MRADRIPEITQGVREPPEIVHQLRRLDGAAVVGGVMDDRHAAFLKNDQLAADDPRR